VATPSGPSLPLAITRSIIQGSVIGPTSFIAMIGDLRPLGADNIYCKYADDLTILCPADSSVPLLLEFEHVQRWAETNKLTINLSKTVEIVFHNPGNKNIARLLPILNIEQVVCVCLLGVFFNNTLSFTPHLDQVLSAISQRFYLLSQLRRQGLNRHGLDTVFKAIILAKVTYACQSFSGYLTQHDIDRLQACLNKAFRWGFSTAPLNITNYFELYDSKLFCKITNNPEHCLHQLLPLKRDMHGRSMRRRGHEYQLPLIKYELHKTSFINKCLFKYA
jgi:hypothetical protein